MLFAVIRQQGPGWDRSLAMRQQAHWDEHVTYINGVADAGFLVLAGPISESDAPDDPTTPVGDDRTYRAMLIVEAPTQEAVIDRLEDDPWTVSGALTTKTIERWDVLVGEVRGAATT